MPDEIDDQQPVARALLSRSLQIVVASILIAVVFLSLAWLVRYAYMNPTVTPTQLRVHEVIVFAVALLVLVLMPWHRLGLRIKKVGWVEFERIVTVQKKEHAETIASLVDRLSALEAMLPREAGVSPDPADATHGITPVQTGEANRQLRDLILTFLKSRPAHYFNAARIRSLARGDERFGTLSDHPSVLLNQELQRLLAAGLVRTRISRRSGDTLYRIA